jgi:hypothetical protein
MWLPHPLELVIFYLYQDHKVKYQIYRYTIR